MRYEFSRKAFQSSPRVGQRGETTTARWSSTSSVGRTFWSWSAAYSDVKWAARPGGPQVAAATLW